MLPSTSRGCDFVLALLRDQIETVLAVSTNSILNKPFRYPQGVL